MELADILQIAIRIGLILATVLYYDRVLEPKRSFPCLLLSLGLLLFLFEVLYVYKPELNYLSANAMPLLSAVVTLAEAFFVMVSLRILTRSGWMRILMFYCLALLISVLSSLLPFALFGLFTGENVAYLVAARWNDLAISLISTVLRIALLIGSAELVGRYLNRQTAELRWSQFAPAIGAQAVSLILCIALTQEDLPARALLITVLAILITIYGLADAVLFQSFRAFVKNSELADQLRAAERQQALQKEYYLSISDQMKTVRRLRHDYKNSMLTMTALMERGETEQARTMADSYKTLLDAAGPGFYSGNEILDTVLNVKAQEAEKLGIAFSAQLSLPFPLRVSDMDLMSVFSNMIDNALEYVRELPRPDKPLVDVSAEVRAGLWVITFQNTYCGDALPSFATTKGDAAAHGQGRAIVRSIVEKYDGTFSDLLQDGMYAAVLTMNIA